jgi:hypothetical protein
MSTYKVVDFNTGINDEEVVTSHLFQERDLALRGVTVILATIRDNTTLEENLGGYRELHKYVQILKKIDPKWRLAPYYIGNCIRLKHYSCDCHSSL